MTKFDCPSDWNLSMNNPKKIALQKKSNPLAAAIGKNLISPINRIFITYKTFLITTLILSLNTFQALDSQLKLWHQEQEYDISSITFPNLGKPFCHNKPRVLKSALPLSNSKKIIFNYFSNSSDTLVVLGPGFPGTHRSTHYLINLLGHSFDYLTFDYEWSSSCIKFIIEKPSRILYPIKSFLFDEHKTVLSAVEYIKSQREYAYIFGFSQCFSTWTFCLAQQAHYIKNPNKPLFDGLILDSSFASFSSLTQHILEDPWLPVNPQHGGFPQRLRKLLLPSLSIKPLTKVANLLIPQTLSSIINTMGPTPLLFIHGSNDVYAPLSDFKEKTWNNLSNKESTYALITPFQHSNNLKERETIHTIVSSFIATSKHHSRLFEAGNQNKSLK